VWINQLMMTRKVTSMLMMKRPHHITVTIYNGDVMWALHVIVVVVLLMMMSKMVAIMTHMMAMVTMARLLSILITFVLMKTW
jgi:hypothetical protein